MESVSLSELEIIEFSGQFINFDIIIGLLLKEKGVPMIGHFSPQPDYENYQYIIEKDPSTAHINVSWRKK